MGFKPNYADRPDERHQRVAETLRVSRAPSRTVMVGLPVLDAGPAGERASCR
jgi:hypothetical protein